MSERVSVWVCVCVVRARARDSSMTVLFDSCYLANRRRAGRQGYAAPLTSSATAADPSQWVGTWDNAKFIIIINNNNYIELLHDTILQYRNRRYYAVVVVVDMSTVERDATSHR